MPRFFIEKNAISGDGDAKSALLTGENARHLALVLRAAPGDKVTLCDGETVYRCEVSAVDGQSVSCRILSSAPTDTEPPARITLYMALPKGDKMDTVIQKAVECGVCAIVPVTTERCIAKISEKDEPKKRERFQKIAEAAAKQCGRGIVPEILPVMRYRDAVARASAASLPLFCYEGTGTESLRAVLTAHPDPGDEISVFVGSEGGFSPAEAEFARGSGMIPVGLGRRILRCETAPLFALSCLAYEYEL